MRRLFVALVLGAGLASGPAVRADWEIRRHGTAAVAAHALRTLRQRPDDPRVVRDVVRLLGRSELTGLLDRLRAGADRSYGDAEALAQLLLALGRAEEAAESFALALRHRPASPAAVRGRAEALAAAGRGREAIEAFAEAVRRERSPRGRRRLLGAWATLAQKEGDVTAELEARRGLLALAPRDLRAASALAKALDRAGDPRAGAALIESRLQERGAGDRRELYILGAALHERAKAPAHASRLLRAALGEAGPRDEGRGAIYARLVALARKTDSLERLEAELSQRTSTAPAAGPEWQALATVREEMGDYEGALAAWRKVAALVPGDLGARRSVIALLDRLGRQDEVTAAYAALERGAGQDPKLALELLDRRFRRGDKEGARQRFDELFRAWRQDVEALAKLADLSSRWGEDDRVLGCWDAVLALSPRDERAIIGVGEAHFQRGRRELARRTWQALLGAVRPRAEAHARLAELLGDHDLVEDALAEARLAVKLEPENPHRHRTMARILERKKDYAAAVATWRVVLAKSTEPERRLERREARARLLNLLAREGRARLQLEAEPLRDYLRRHPADREGALYLAELDLRLQEPDRAVQTLRLAAEANPGDGDVTLMLVRLLRQSHQHQEAIRWLERLSQSAPERALDAELQTADLELQRYRDEAAIAALDRARRLGQRDPEALARVAALEARAGRTDRALETYDRALAQDVPTRAATASFQIRIRRGDLPGALSALLLVADRAADPETRAELVEQAEDLAELLGALPELERTLLDAPGPGTAAERRALATLLRRRVPGLYVAAENDPTAARELAALGRRSLRALLDLVTDPEGEPDPRAVELLGLLGNRHATPVLVRLARGHAGQAPRARPPGTRADDRGIARAALLALGRLRDPRAHAALVELATSPDAGIRNAALWALGRLDRGQPIAALEEALRDPRPDVTALAALGLGRARDERAARTLAALATDVTRGDLPRRAAVLALGFSARPEAEALLPLLDAPDRALARAAAAAVGMAADRRSLPELWRRALLAPRAGAEHAVEALQRFAAGPGAPDEARAIREDKLEVGALLDALAAPARPHPEAFEALWTGHVHEIAEVLTTALDSPTTQRAALAALQSQAADLGLGLLVVSTAAPTPRARAALAAVGERVRDEVAALLDAPDPETRRLAIRVAAKLRDPRLSVAHVVALVGPGAAPDWDPTTAEAGSGARLVAEVLLARGPAEAAGLVAALRPRLDDPSWESRLAATRVLALVPGPARAPLAKALDDASPFVRAEAARALAGAASAELLERMARDQAAAVRAVAARALVRRADPRAFSLLERLRRDDVATVREAARAAPVGRAAKPGTGR